MARGGRDRPDRDDRAGGISDSEFAGLILDEEFVRAARVKEPAAAQRDTMGPIAAPPRPPRLRLSTPPRTRAPLAWLRRRMASIVVLVLIAAMVAGSIGPFASRRPATGTDDDAGDQPAPSSERPSPFGGTPAMQFADNEGGLVLPSAAAVDGFGTAEVALALHAVRRALVHANLDRTVTTGGSAGPYLDVVGPETAARVEAALTDGSPGATDHLTRFPAEGVELAADVPVKVAGTFRYRAGSPGVLAIDTRHVFAYPTVPAGVEGPGAAGRRGETGAEVVVVRRETTWEVTRTAEGSLSAPELTTSEVATSGHCLVDDGGYVWPRFTAPDQPARRGEGVPVEWNVADPLVAGTDCFLPVATRA